MKLQRFLTVTTLQLGVNCLLGQIRREEHICQESAPTDLWLLGQSMSQGSQLKKNKHKTTKPQKWVHPKCSISLAFSTFASSKTFIITSFHPTSYLVFKLLGLPRPDQVFFAFRASTPPPSFLCF